MPEQFLHGTEVVELNDGTRPIQTVKSSVIGVVGTAPDADTTKFPPNQPVLIAGNPTEANALGNAGTLKNAVDSVFDQTGAWTVLVRVEEGADTDATISNIVGDTTAMTGVHALKGAASEVKVQPRLFCAPGFTSQRPGNAANPIVSELQPIAKSARGIILADTPNTGRTDAITYREDWGSDRIYIVDPWVKVWDTLTNQNVDMPASARVAGMIARMDNTNGFWWSPSNQIMNGITGPSRPIDFSLSDTNCEANLLNQKEVATIIQKDGYRLWGNRTTASDPLWAFLSVRRTHDMVYESVEEAMFWAMDRPQSANLFTDIQESVNAYLRRLTNIGALLGGECWVDPVLNTKEKLMAGELFIDFDSEAPAPAEHITFRAHRNNGYYEELMTRVVQTV